MKHTIPTRAQIPREDQWDLSSLFTSPQDWEEAFAQLDSYIEQAKPFAGTLGSSPRRLREFLDFLNETGMLMERLEYYALLKYSEDAGDSVNQARMGMITQKSAQAAAAFSFVEPELMEIETERMDQLLSDPLIKPFEIKLTKILRFRPYTLSSDQERLLALQADAAETPSQTFEALTNVDLEFGSVETEEGAKPLSQSTLASFLQHENREVRRSAYMQFYRQFDAHKHTLSSLYSGSVKQDAYRAQVRGFSSSRAMALYPDNVDEQVYDNLIEEVRSGHSSLQRYYRLKQQVRGLDELRHYDVYLPFSSGVKTRYSFDEAVDTVCNALSVLGDEYTGVIREGLTGGWVDKYENKGKRSGAFSAGSYTGYPYILMNYKEDVLRDLFTLAHEGGHSMHSHYSAKHNPFQHYQYTIFEAEVASTFNEQLLADYLLQHAETPQMRAYIIGKQLDDIVATIFRQTMFAEFEHTVHRLYEDGTPLTVELLRGTYRELMNAYLGSGVTLEEISDLEGLRIPHFYRAFYVYKYATGLSAALALSRQVTQGGEAQRQRYLRFLASGGSAFPIESLSEAGVDMSSREPVREAVAVFDRLLDQMEDLI